MTEVEASTRVQDLDLLVSWFKQFRSCLVALSAGVDSSVLAFAAFRALEENATAVTSRSPSFARNELEESSKIADEIGIRHILVEQYDLGDADYVSNQVSRCYFCRANLAKSVAPIVIQYSIEVCVDGTQMDDLNAPRPGVKALREAGFRAPFVELGFSKDRIREIARSVGLSNSEKPSDACLSSRIAYGQRIDEETLKLVETAELIVKSITGARIVRVRTIGRRALVELDQATLTKGEFKQHDIEMRLKEIGYDRVEIAKDGYVSGRMLSIVSSKRS